MTGLENVPSMTGYFDPNDLKGVLTDMPEYKHNEEIMDPPTLGKIMEDNAQNLSMVEKLGHPEQAKTSLDKRVEALSVRDKYI